MLSVLVLDPVLRSAWSVRPALCCLDQAFEAHQAGMAKQVRADLALFEWRKVDAVNPPRKILCQVGLAHRQRQLADVLAVADQDVEGIEFDLRIVLAAVQSR